MEEQGSLSTSGQTYCEDMLNMTVDDQPEIDTGNSEVTRFFDGLNVLVTGGSGFLGKLLVEKLLR